MTNTTGFLTDGFVTYPSDLECKWLIAPPGDDRITFTLEYLNTEESYDYVRIYDGVDDTAPLLAEVSGWLLPSPSTYTSSGGAMYITFTTDAAVQDYGFEGVYEVVSSV